MSNIGYIKLSLLIILLNRILMDGIRMRDELDYMRFIAKDLWISLFGKQVDNLRTDNNVRDLIGFEHVSTFNNNIIINI